MSRNHAPVMTPLEVLHVLRANPRRWIVPAVAFGLIAAVYAVLRPATWDASQALMVRDEAMGASSRPGKFLQLDDMKTVQETILELARNRSVLAAALADVGPDAKNMNVRPWPNDAAVVALQSRVKLTPPKGAEFGKTEVFYLNVEAENPTRAVALTAAICKELQARSQELRDLKAQSLISELVKTAELAKAGLATTTEKLTKIESRVGTDLGELRLLNDTNGGESPLRHSVSEMEHELRDAHQAIEANEELLAVLTASKNDTGSLTAAPNRLLESQPVLRRLKDGLVDAQLRTAALAGNMTSDHPLVAAAKISESEIAAHVREEIDGAIRGVQVELRLSQNRAAALESQLADARQRLTGLAEMRAEYGNLVNERNQRSDIVKAAEQELAEARASQAAARTASLITAIDAPVAGDSPVGPGKATIVFGGMVGGLFVGLGIVFLTVETGRTERLAAHTRAVTKPFETSAHDASRAVLAEWMAGPATKEVQLNGSANCPSNLSLKEALGKLAGVR